MMTDVVIVGAGLAGLSAARYLSSRNVTCLVIEARTRVGGRTLSQKAPDECEFTIDLGGQWIGPTQKRVLSLVEEFGLPLIEQTWHSSYPEDLGQAVGLIRLTHEQEQTVIDVYDIWDKMAEELTNLEQVWLNEKAKEWAEMSVASYIDDPTLGFDERLRLELKLQVLTMTACNPERLSLLHWLLTLRSIPGGSSSLDDGNKGAQHFKIAAGSQQLSILLAEKQDIRLGDGLVSVDYSSPSEIVLTLLSGNKLTCRRLLLAFSPTLLSRVSFMPSLSSDWHCHMTMGQCIKTVFIYSTPFWRGIETNQTEQQGPCSNIFDLAQPTALIGLILGDQASLWCDREENELVEAIIKQYNTLYRTDHQPIHTFIKYWQKEEWSGGCYAGVYPPGSISRWENKRKTFVDGRIWLASTETASEWVGYMEGAIEAGESTAKYILNMLQ
ncbi:unnamed protein product [Rotaria magnacalcarata]|uniref:Amine oxidase n=1 Tax=Rotaria magnacalcarata TaxID=392030 RepID=A0A819SSW6_9BILA|nr:unnamed protein product [Rotaria magnacalcarata]CAF2048408.1 unnamed protein product [Rotaria magnacalcarata]CAF4076449.1 unnamed protein product [Rotaria magnacalcarata]CAF4133076.1 unnamed protein product [Rotaria magnacalcarata]